MTGTDAPEPLAGLADIARMVEAEADAAVPPQVTAAARVVCADLGEAVGAVLFYGSALRDGDIKGKVIDLYALVDQYRLAYGNILPAAANRLLPPNVYYLQTAGEQNVIRIKYAVISFDQFEQQAAGKAFTPYIWARFAQPTALVYSRDQRSRQRVVGALQQAALTLLMKTVRLMGTSFSSQDFWPHALRASYRTELRAEGSSKASELYSLSRDRFDTLLENASGMGLGYRQGTSGGTYIRTGTQTQHVLTRVAWLVRRPVGKFLSVMRLVKATFTFNNGVDYILWKVERHSGVKVTATDWQRRHPLMAATVLAWRLYVRRGFR